MLTNIEKLITFALVASFVSACGTEQTNTNTSVQAVPPLLAQQGAAAVGELRCRGVSRARGVPRGVIRPGVVRPGATRPGEARGVSARCWFSRRFWLSSATSDCVSARNMRIRPSGASLRPRFSSGSSAAVSDSFRFLRASTRRLSSTFILQVSCNLRAASAIRIDRSSRS